MLPDRVSNPGPLTYESDALLIALRGLAWSLNTTLTILYFPDIDEVPSRSTHWSAAPLVLGWISGGRGGVVRGGGRNFLNC